MARKSADGAIGATKATLIEYAQRAGRKVVLVPPAYTTMTCSECGARAKSRLLLSERVFVCDSCEMIQDRDRNAARVILDRLVSTLSVLKQSDIRISLSFGCLPSRESPPLGRGGRQKRSSRTDLLLVAFAVLVPERGSLRQLVRVVTRSSVRYRLVICPP
jgi:hypothetical protein